MIRYVAGGQQNPIQLPRWLPTRNRRYFKARRWCITTSPRRCSPRRSLPQDQWPDDLLTKLMLAHDGQEPARL